jgi:hypothetical protein
MLALERTRKDVVAQISHLKAHAEVILTDEIPKQEYMMILLNRRTLVLEKELRKTRRIRNE